MTYNLLLVEDEHGIREGLASYLQLKGYSVSTAGSCADGLLAMADTEFDAVITDWHLGDGTGAAIVGACQCPAIVVSGVPEAVDLAGHPGQALVMQKPVLPPVLVERIAAMLADAENAEAVEESALPVDAQDRIDLMRALVKIRHEVDEQSITVHDDGTYVTFEARLSHEDDELQEYATKIGGDVRCLDRGGYPVLEMRIFRTGQRSVEDCLVGPNEPWPESPVTIGVDFSRADHCAPPRFLELIERAESVRQAGGSAYFLNVPAHLRLHLELLGRARELPVRQAAGPELPAIMTELWR